MPSPIEIRTLSGVRLDVLPSATVEVNMGGISLLDLSSRTATYTNSFSLPRTPTNEAVFEFASQPTRNNRPVINVTITKGLFQKKAVLKVLEFGSEYKCSVSYDIGFISDSKNVSVNIIPNMGTIPLPYDTREEVLAVLFDDDAIDLDYFTLKTNTNLVTNQWASTGNSAIKINKLLSLFGTQFGYTFSGALLSDLDFQSCMLALPNYGYEIELISGFYYPKKVKLYDIEIKIGDVLNVISQIFLADFKITNNNIEISKLDFTTSISIEGFKSVNKKHYSGLQKNNYINYKNSGVDKFFGGDLFVADGEGDKVLLELNANVPLTDNLGRYITNDKSRDLRIFAITSKASDNASIYVAPTTLITTTTEMYKANILSLSPFYSTILNPIFANPVILEADKYLDPLTADTIMNTRVINSVQLGGRYWVDTMAYNLTTGQSKMTLIKLP